MTRFVLDSSYALSWLFPDEHTTERVHTLRGLARHRSTAIVLPLWVYEVANTLIVGERRGRITQAESAEFFEKLRALPIEITSEDLFDLCDEASSLARQHQLSAYDASYLALALTMALPLATLDSPLQKAAKKCGVSLIES
jgi:predicted nucleic acid-binding protein